jgi:hypothetical protein
MQQHGNRYTAMSAERTLSANKHSPTSPATSPAHGVCQHTRCYRITGTTTARRYL